jgi:hypothetical protein
LYAKIFLAKALCRGVLYVCAELAVSGIDDDKVAWSDGHAAATNNGVDGHWENDRIALHPESLIKLFVEILEESSTLPSIFGIIDRLLTLGPTTPPPWVVTDRESHGTNDTSHTRTAGTSDTEFLSSSSGSDDIEGRGGRQRCRRGREDD